MSDDVEDGITVTVKKKRTVNLGDYNSAMAEVEIANVPADSVEHAEEVIDDVLDRANEKVHEDLSKEVNPDD